MTGSMTGYGSAERGLKETSLLVEVRSVNHRYLETSIRAPRWALPLEGKVREEVKRRFARGRFDVFIRLGSGQNGVPYFDPASARNFVDSLRRLGEELGIPGEVDMAVLAQFRDALRSGESSLTAGEMEAPLMEALGEALSALGGMRRVEGENIEEDILAHLAEAERLTSGLRSRLPEAQAALSARMRDRIAKVAEEVSLDEGRLEQELIYAAERGDISEELNRLESHASQFRELIGGSGPVGRKLDFLLQELNREANTIASKSVDLSLTQMAVDLKSALEKIREQVQNIE